MSGRKEAEFKKAPPGRETNQRKKASLVWIVPVLAAAAASWLVYDRLRSFGPLITVVFDDGQGLRVGQTQVRYRGVKIGDLRSVGLTKDAQHVEAHLRLDKSAKSLARDGAMFWVVRPEVSAGGLHGLETLVSGTYIQVQPGMGKEQKSFTGLEHPPMVPSSRRGLEIYLMASELGSLNAGSPVYYRGMEVGSVDYYTLSDDATQVKVRARIDSRYASLVTQETKFWNAGGLSMSLKLFGFNISAESIKSLLTGGVAFATPPVPGPPAAAGSIFPLYEKAEEKWLKWATPLPGWDHSKTNAPNYE